MASVPPASEVKFEEWVVAQVAGPLKDMVKQALSAIIALYLRLAGSMGAPIPPQYRQQFAIEAARIVRRVAFGEQNKLISFIEWALALGAARATAAGVAAPAGVAAAAIADNTPVASLPDWVDNVAATIADRVGAVLASAVSQWQIGAPPADMRDVMGRIARLQQAVTLVERDAAWATNAAINAGSRDQMDMAGVARVWFSEDDACLHCLAYTGHVAQPGQPYPGGLTFYIDPRGVPKPLGWAPVWGPPLHPHCRCREEPYLGSENYPVMPWETGETTLSDALKREARRKVLRGESGSDSLPARLRATDALLTVGARLPKTVQARARAAVKAGTYR